MLIMLISDGNVGVLVRPLLWSRLNYLDNYFIIHYPQRKNPTNISSSTTVSLTFLLLSKMSEQPLD